MKCVWLSAKSITIILIRILQLRVFHVKDRVLIKDFVIIVFNKKDSFLMSYSCGRILFVLLSAELLAATIRTRMCKRKVLRSQSVF